MRRPGTWGLDKDFKSKTSLLARLEATLKDANSLIAQLNEKSATIDLICERQGGAADYVPGIKTITIKR